MAHPDHLAASTSRPVGHELPSCSLYDFLFSNPFRQDSPIITGAPSAATRNHHIHIIPPQKPIFIEADQHGIEQSLTWQELQRRSLVVGHHLNHQLGLNPSAMVPSKTSQLPSGRSSGLLSPVVLLHLPNGTAFVTVLLGALAAGLTLSMVNPAFTCHELVDVLRSAKPSLIVTSSSGLDTLLNALALIEETQLRTRLSQHIYIADPPHSAALASLSQLDSQITIPRETPNGDNVTLVSWSTLLQPSPIGSTPYQPFQFTQPHYESRSRIAAIIWSSGTSGKSKGVLCSHYAMIHSIISFWHQKLDYGPDERTVGLLPFCHILGLQAVVLFSIAAGSTVHIMQKFEPRRYLEEITKSKITSLQVAPPIAAFLAKSLLLDKNRYDLSSVRDAMSGGAPLAPEIVTMVYKRCGFWVKSAYGLSEACHVSNQLGETMAELLPQLGTVGEVMYGVELKILSCCTKQLVARNEEGEILIRSPSMMTGYLDRPTETSQALDHEGWLHTGDIGFLDHQGRLTITGRLKEIIITKGYQVAPSELEALIRKIDSVDEVAVTAVYCHQQATELPRAYVVPQGSLLTLLCDILNSLSPANPTLHPRYKHLVQLAQQIKEFVESHAAHYKWLKGNIILTSHIPKSPSGKVLKRMLSSTPGLEIPLYNNAPARTLSSATSKL